MAFSEKLLNIIALMKCEDYHTKKATIGFALKLPTLKQGQQLKCKRADFDETYRISKVHSTYHLYVE